MLSLTTFTGNLSKSVLYVLFLTILNKMGGNIIPVVRNSQYGGSLVVM